MILLAIGIISLVYIFLLLISFTYSCGGWDKSCGLCWIGIVQSPLIIIDWIISKIKNMIKGNKNDSDLKADVKKVHVVHKRNLPDDVKEFFKKSKYDLYWAIEFENIRYANSY